MKSFIYVSILGITEYESSVGSYSLLLSHHRKNFIFEKVKTDWYNLIAGGGQPKESFSLEDVFKVYYNEFIKPRFISQFNL